MPPWTYPAPRPQARKLCPELRTVVDALEAGQDRVIVRLRPDLPAATFRGLVSTFARRQGLLPLRCRRTTDPAVYEVVLDPEARAPKIVQERARGPRPGRQTAELRRVVATMARGRASVWVELPEDVSRSAFGDSLRRYCRRHGMAPLGIRRAEQEGGRVYVVGNQHRVESGWCCEVDSSRGKPPFSTRTHG